jgi:hypothetical protein
VRAPPPSAQRQQLALLYGRRVAGGCAILCVCIAVAVRAAIASPPIVVRGLRG